MHIIYLACKHNYTVTVTRESHELNLIKDNCTLTLTNDHWANLGKDNYTLTQIIVESISKNSTLYWLKLLLSQSVMTQLNTDSNKWLLSQSVKTLYIDSNKWYLSHNYTNSSDCWASQSRHNCTLTQTNDHWAKLDKDATTMDCL